MGNIDLMPRKKWMKILRKFVSGSISRALKWMMGLDGGLTKLTVYVPISRYSFTMKKDVIHGEQQGHATKESDPSTQPKPEWTVNVANKQNNGEDKVPGLR